MKNCPAPTSTNDKDNEALQPNGHRQTLLPWAKESRVHSIPTSDAGKRKSTSVARKGTEAVAKAGCQTLLDFPIVLDSNSDSTSDLSISTSAARMDREAAAANPDAVSAWTRRLLLPTQTLCLYGQGGYCCQLRLHV